MRAPLVVAAAALVVASAVALAAPAPAPTIARREAARYVLELYCGNCHREDSPRALPKALKVFNLNHVEWAETMSDRQLRDAIRRLRDQSELKKSDFDAFAKDLAVFGAPVEKSDLEAFRAYAEAELLHRAAR